MDFRYSSPGAGGGPSSCAGVPNGLLTFSAAGSMTRAPSWSPRKKRCGGVSAPRSVTRELPPQLDGRQDTGRHAVLRAVILDDRVRRARLHDDGGLLVQHRVGDGGGPDMIVT